MSYVIGITFIVSSLLCCVSIGEVVKGQAEADDDASLKERGKMGVGKGSFHSVAPSITT